jgi:hypothetical protein
VNQFERQSRRCNAYREAMTELMESLTRPGSGARERAEKIIERAIDKAWEGVADDD